MIYRCLITLCLFLSSFSLHANLRWFDVELIFFERALDPELKEHLASDDLPEIDYTGTQDLIADAYRESIQGDNPDCLTLNAFGQRSQQPEQEVSTHQSLDDRQFSLGADQNNLTSTSSTTPVVETKACQPDASVSRLKAIPLTPLALTHEHTDYLYLLSQEQLLLNETVTRLRRRGLTPLLHTGWRQPESNKRNATPIYLYGGTNLSIKLDEMDKLKRKEELSTQSSIGESLDELNQSRDTALTETDRNELSMQTDALSSQPERDETVSTQTWQLQGKFNVFIRRNYLNIEADFDLNELAEQTVERFAITENQAVTKFSEPLTHTVINRYRFSQFKRVISSEIHYLDHPRLGIILQIRRYNH